MGRQGVHVFAQSLSYRNKTVRLPDGSTHTFLAAEEKGVDVRMALDIVRMAHRREYDVALILSQDQDLSEVAEEIRIDRATYDARLDRRDYRRWEPPPTGGGR